MKTRLVKRHYCDFCRKSGAQLPHMERHERGCTLNPNRECGICPYLGDAYEGPATSLDDLKASLPPAVNGEMFLDAATVQRLRLLAHGCPACMLAALRQSAAYWNR